MFTADGQLLGFRNHRDADVMRGVLANALAAFRKLPESQRKPGAIKVPELGTADANFDRKPPKGGLVVNVFTRILDKDASGEFCQGKCDFQGGDRSAHDHMWLTEEEWKALIPATPKKGEATALPPRIAMRLMRFHLVDNTRGEPAQWDRKEVRSCTMTVTVSEISEKEIVLKLEGSALLMTEADPQQAKRGYDVGLLATLRYNVVSKKIEKLDGVALGHHWGVGAYTPGARPGRTLLGVAFELARGDSPMDTVPPQGARYLRGYLQADGD